MFTMAFIFFSAYHLKIKMLIFTSTSMFKVQGLKVQGLKVQVKKYL